MAWQTVAEGVSLAQLKPLVTDMELPKGTRVRVVMDTWAPWAFDAAGAELLFRPFMPNGLGLIDVYGEEGQGIVEMEADPAWLVATLAFIKAHWVAITIAGLALTLLISFIRVMVEVPAWALPPIWLIVGGAAALLFLLLYMAPRRNPRRRLKGGAR